MTKDRLSSRGVARSWPTCRERKRKSKKERNESKLTSARRPDWKPSERSKKKSSASNSDSVKSSRKERSCESESSRRRSKLESKLD